MLSRSYRIGVKVTDDERWCFIDSLRFDDYLAASQYAGELLLRWHLDVEVKVFPSEEEPNAFKRSAA